MIILKTQPSEQPSVVTVAQHFKTWIKGSCHLRLITWFQYCRADISETLTPPSPRAFPLYSCALFILSKPNLLTDWLTDYLHVIHKRVPLGFLRSAHYIGKHFATVKGSALKMLGRIMTGFIRVSVWVHISVCVCVFDHVSLALSPCVFECVCIIDLFRASPLDSWFSGQRETASPPAELNRMFLKP